MKKINECGCGGSCRSKGELVLKQMTIVGMHEDWIEVVLDNKFFHESGKNRSYGDRPVVKKSLAISHIIGRPDGQRPR